MTLFRSEDERGAWADVGPGRAIGIGKGRRQEDFPFGSDVHHLKRFTPSFDDSVDSELRGFGSVFGRAIKLFAVDQRAAVNDAHGVVAVWCFARAFFNDLILQLARFAVGQRDHFGFDAGFLFVFGKEGLSLFLVFFSRFGHLITLVIANGFAGLDRREFRGLAGEHLFHGGNDGIYIHIHVAAFDLGPKNDADAVAGFFLVILEIGGGLIVGLRRRRGGES